MVTKYRTRSNLRNSGFTLAHISSMEQSIMLGLALWQEHNHYTGGQKVETVQEVRTDYKNLSHVLSDLLPPMSPQNLKIPQSS